MTGAQQLTGISCPRATLCEAVGFTAVGNSDEGTVTQIVNGAPSGTQLVPGINTFDGVACPTVTACVAVGYGVNSSSHKAAAIVVPVDNGVPGSAEPVPGAEPLFGVACPSQATCYAVGDTETAVGAPTSEAGIVLPIVNGVPQAAIEVPTTQALIAAACPSKTACFATGVSQPGNHPAIEAAIVSVTNGEPEKTATIIPQAGQLNGAACPSAQLCVAAGMTSSSPLGIAVPFANGWPATPQDIAGTYSFNGIACPTSSACEAVGVSETGNPFEGVVATISVSGK